MTWLTSLCHVFDLASFFYFDYLTYLFFAFATKLNLVVYFANTRAMLLAVNILFFSFSVSLFSIKLQQHC